MKSRTKMLLWSNWQRRKFGLLPRIENSDLTPLNPPTVDRLRRLRRTLAGLEVPLTLERAPWPVRAAVGHFGAYREGVGPLVAGLRRTFDPGEALVVAVEGTE